LDALLAALLALHGTATAPSNNPADVRNLRRETHSLSGITKPPL
jgi:hypothetical protein